MTSVKRIKIDPEAVKADVIVPLKTLESALESDTGAFQECANGVEHPVLDGALNEFEERWSDKRHKLQDGLRKTRESVQAAVDSFVEADQALADATEGAGR